MVGDWVHYRVDLGKDGFYEKDIQINNIYGCDVNCKLEYEEIISGTPLYYCYPIPLTPEILEKNGFNHWDEDYNDFIGDYYTFLSNKDGGYNICIDSKMTISGHIDYVHELQHALKLCEIEKNIEL